MKKGLIEAIVAYETSLKLQKYAILILKCIAKKATGQ